MILLPFAEHFVVNPSEEKCINHLDGNKLNNKVENLEWSSYSKNMKHSYDTGLHKPYDMKGENNPCAKLDEEKVAFIRKVYQLKGISQRKLALYFGVSQKVIHNVVNKRSWTMVDELGPMSKEEYYYYKNM